MKWYIDITLLPDAGTPIYFLWEMIYKEIHSILAKHGFDRDVRVGKEKKKEIIKISKIGVSFPEYKQNKLHPLGNKLRLMAYDQDQLEVLNLTALFANFLDNMHLKSIQAIPTEKITGYAFFKREQVKSNNQRLAKRRANKKDVNYDEALSYFNENTERKQPKYTTTKAPFIYMNSHSKNQRFPLFIVMEQIDTPTETEEFSSYGLSSTSTVPIF